MTVSFRSIRYEFQFTLPSLVQKREAKNRPLPFIFPNHLACTTVQVGAYTYSRWDIHGVAYIRLDIIVGII